MESLFNEFGYEKTFNREKVEKAFSVKKARALEVISQLIDCDILESLEETKYRFKK